MQNNLSKIFPLFKFSIILWQELGRYSGDIFFADSIIIYEDWRIIRTVIFFPKIDSDSRIANFSKPALPITEICNGLKSEKGAI